MSAAWTPLALRVGLQDLVGRARIHVVGAFEHPALHADVLHQVVHRGNRLLIGRRPGVDHVLRRLLAFVLHGIEQQPVVLLEHRQHRLSRDRRPAPEDDRDFVLLQELARFLGEERPVRRRIDDHGLELLAEQAALLVLRVDEHQHGVFERGLADGHRARQRMQHAHLDRGLSGCPARPCHPRRQEPSGQEYVLAIHGQLPSPRLHICNWMPTPTCLKLVWTASKRVSL